VNVIINGLAFKSNEAAKGYARDIFNSYDIGQTVSPEDARFLIATLRHRGPDGDEKLGCGVLRIYLGTNDYGQKSFWLERVDGTKTDFSFIKCFSRKTPRTKKTDRRVDFERACRWAVKNDSLRARGRSGCEFVAHHEGKPFAKIVDGFVSATQVDVETVEFVGHDDGETHVEFVDKRLEAQWVAYHRDEARFSILTPAEHKKRHEKGSRKSEGRR
jgi:hypothetical protein